MARYLHLNRQPKSRIIEFAFDVLGLIGAWYCTFFLRLFLNPLFSRHLTGGQLAALAPPITYIVLLWLVATLWLWFYRPEHQIRAAAGLMNLVESAAIASLLTIVVTFFFREFGAELSRSFVLLFMPVSLVVMLATRYAAVLLIDAMQERSPERVAVVGEGEEALRVVECVRSAPGSTVFAGMIVPEHQKASDAAERMPVLGTTSMLAALINSTRLDRIIIVNGVIPESEVDRCGVISSRMGIVLNRTVSVPLSGARIDLSQRFGMPLLELRPVAFTRRQEIVKRAFDVLVAGITLILVSPAMIAFAILVKLTSPGPVFYRAPRVGRGGRHFSFLKFRTMYVHPRGRGEVARMNEKDGKIFKIKNDPRVTPVGLFMRRYSVDEIPQLFNVLRGEMSLVGPRPLPAEDLDPDGQSREFAAWSEQRSRVLPGITGLWQIRGRSDLTFSEMINLDVEYIRTWSLDLDLRIMLATPLVVLTGKGAY